MAGAVLATQAFTMTAWCNAMFDVNFEIPAAVAAGGTYTFRVQATGTTFFHLVHTGNLYANGIYHSSDYGTPTGWDMVFKTWVAAAPRFSVTDTGLVGIGISPRRPLHVNDVMRLEPRAAPPSSPGEGDLYYDQSLKKLRYYDGASWVSL